MANYQNLLDSIASVIHQNGNQEITGEILKSTLQSMVSVLGANATYGGVAHIADNPGTPDGPVIYIASDVGVYPNFGALEILTDELAVFVWDPTAGSWSKESITYIADKSEIEDLIQQGIEDINGAKDDAIEEIEQIVQSVDVTYETISGDNVQLKNGGGDLLMPKTGAENVTYDKSISGLGNGDVQSAINEIGGGDYTFVDLASKKISGKAIRNSGSVGSTAAMTETTDAHWTCVNITCSFGAKFRLTAGAGSTYVAYTFLDANNKILATSGTGARLDHQIITAPSHTVRLVANSSDNVIPAMYIDKVEKNDAKYEVRKKIYLKRGYTIQNNASIGAVNTPTVTISAGSNNFGCAIIDVVAGERYVLNGYGGNLYKVYAILDASNKVLESCAGVISSATAYKDEVIKIPNNGVKMILDINYESCGGYFEKIVDVSEANNDDEDVVFGYERRYNDITSNLTLEAKTIDSGAIVDSTTNVLMSEMPNNGVVEVRLNQAEGKFKVFKDDGTITELTNGWEYYQFRYVGDYSSTYYVLISLETEADITFIQASKIVKVYKLDDIGSKTKKKNLSLLNNKKIAFFGDSIVQGRFPNFGTSVNMVMDSPYSNIISGWIGEKSPSNFGLGGALVYNNNWRSLYANCTKITGYDIVFVCAGTNDWSGNVTIANFTTAYNYVVTTLLANNTSVVLMTPTAREGHQSTKNSQNLLLNAYSQVVRDVANAKGCTLIELQGLTNTTDYLSTLPDGLHPNEEGHSIIANLILENLQ